MTQITLAAVGDIMVNREDPLTILDHVLPDLRRADIRFCQLETAYSPLGSPGSSGRRGVLPHDPRNYAVLPAAFTVVSMASNHTMDWGQDAFLDCIENLRSDGLSPIGGGRDLAQARQPAELQFGSTRVAMLAYCSVAPEGYYAGAPDKPGVAPMRAITHYEPLEIDQPGTPPRIMTFPDELDLERLVADVRQARASADVVIVSLHWGIHYVRAMLADYQSAVAHAAIDAGADLILGHHPHKLKAVEVYRGKVIFYSIGNFAFDRLPRTGVDLEYMGRNKAVYQSRYGMADPEEGATRYTFEADAKFSMIARARLSENGVDALSFVPVVIGHDSAPVPYPPSSPEGKAVLDYLSAVTAEAGLPCVYEPAADDSEILIQV